MSNQNTPTKTWQRGATKLAMDYARRSPGSLFKPGDLKGTTPTAAARALARLAEKGLLKRVAKGLYYAPKETLLGLSQPSALAVLQETMAGNARPTGATAANLLGVSTQVPARAEFVLYASAKPRNATAARIKLRRVSGGTRAKHEVLSRMDAALLEFFRDRGTRSELESEATLKRLRQVFLEEHKAELAQSKASGQLKSLISVAMHEPPRVRAMLGALLQWSEVSDTLYRPLKESLNPLTRFEFGLFRALPNAKEWQAR